MSASFAFTGISPSATPNSALELTGAEIVVRALQRQQVDIVAGVPGGAALPLYDALARCTRIRHVLARHEQAAGFIAQGIARITRRAGVCIATSGPGVTNLVTAIADAKADSIPLVCITGQVPQHLLGTNAFQEVATLELVRPITKAAWMARDANELDELIAEAFHIAESGRQGPVWIDIPKDVQLQRCAIKNAARLRETRLPTCSTAFDQAAAIINGSQRPVLYAGGGVVKARAQHALQRLAEQGAIPVTTTLMAMGAMPHDHALNLGMLGMHGAMTTHHVLEECDLLIALGARFDDRATGDAQRFVPNAKIIHIDIDAREFGKIKQPTLAVHADAWTALTKLLARVTKAPRSDWLMRIHALRERYPRAKSTCAPTDLIRTIGATLPTDAILTTDVGQHQMWVAQAYPFARADRWLTSGGLGTMGFGLPAAIGAALAEPEATVACFTGDGSLLMNIQELATLAELDVNVKIILFDNASLGMVRQQQEMFYSRRYCASQFNRPTDFIRVAQAFGVRAIELRADSSQEQWAAALDGRGPLLVRVPLGQEHNVLPMVPSGAANIEALE